MPDTLLDAAEAERVADTLDATLDRMLADPLPRADVPVYRVPVGDR